jgi:hypothetical protein
MAAEPWHVRATSVREHNGSLRWTIEASCGCQVATVICDSTTDGRLLDLQSESHIDPELDRECRRHVGDVMALRSVLHSLPRIEVTRHRSDRLRAA